MVFCSTRRPSSSIVTAKSNGFRRSSNSFSGRSSAAIPRLDPDQLALGLDGLDGDIGRAEANGPHVDVEIADKRPRRKPLADHLPREEVVIDVANDACPCCGGVLHIIGESVSEMVDWVSAQLRVLRITRPKYACRTCNTAAQAPAPERPIAGGLATPALLAQVLVSRYCDHTSLYRQAQNFARHGVELERSTLAGWVGGAGWWLEGLDDRLGKDVFAPDHLFASDTPVPVLDPCRGRTRLVGFGSMRVISDHGAGRRHPRRSTSSRRTGRRSGQRRIWNTSRECCTSMAMPASSG
jgi:transposase